MSSDTPDDYTETDWWREEADRVNKMAQFARENGFVMGTDPPDDDELDDGEEFDDDQE